MGRRSVVSCAAVVLLAGGLAGCGSSGAAAKKGSGSGSGSGASAKSASYSSSGYSYGTSAKGGSARSGGQGASVVAAHAVKGLGAVLTAGPKRLTVYAFARDKAGKSACNGGCTTIWPPLKAGGKLKGLGGVATTKLGTITRADGEKQVTYYGHPLYYYAADTSAGEALGEGLYSFGAHWFVLSAKGAEVKKGSASGSTKGSASGSTKGSASGSTKGGWAG
ncbi:MAG: COG4315 family predicted lipoprotein [Solirubrobacteraceae bacterium]